MRTWIGRAGAPVVAVLALGLIGLPGRPALAEPPPAIAGDATVEAVRQRVSEVRARSGLRSALADDVVADKLSRLVVWMVRSYQASGEVHLVPALPEGRARGRATAQHDVLQKTYWLRNNALYAAAALSQYTPQMGMGLEASRTKWTAERFPGLCPDSDSDFIVGRVPSYWRPGESPADGRCAITPPGDWQKFAVTQHPPAKSLAQLDDEPFIIGIDHVQDADGRTTIRPIGRSNHRDLLTDGCIRQAVLGQRQKAAEFFRLSLDLWDGYGFVEAKADPDSRAFRPGLAGQYWTRSLAFTLICAHAIGVGQDPAWTAADGRLVPKLAIEQRLWSLATDDGGLYAGYCDPERITNRRACSADGISASAKETNEIAPLVALAYGTTLWNP